MVAITNDPGGRVVSASEESIVVSGRGYIPAQAGGRIDERSWAMLELERKVFVVMIERRKRQQNATCYRQDYILQRNIKHKHRVWRMHVSRWVIKASKVM